MKCILLVRVSTEAQTYDEQERELRELAKQKGYSDSDIVSVAYKESGIKLSEEERLGLNEMKRLIESGGYDCVFAWEISRIARTKKVLFSIEAYLLEHKIQLIIKSPQIKLLKDDGTIDEGAEMAFTLFAQYAESEMRNKKERFSRGKKQKAREGKYSGGFLPYGYTYRQEDRGKLILVDEEEANNVKLIYNLYEGGLSQPKIAKELERKGVFGIKISLINHILMNRSYTGELHKPKNDYNERLYPPIISKEQYEKCREIARSNNTNLGKTKHVYFAENLIHCKTCGSKWSATGSKTAYHCYNAYKSKSLYYYEYTHKPQCTNKTSLSINLLDSFLWHLASDKESLSVFKKDRSIKEECERTIERCADMLKNIKERIDRVNKKLNRLAIVYIDGMDEKVYYEKRSKLKSEEQEIKEEEVRYIDERDRAQKMLSQLNRDENLNKIYANSIEYLKELRSITDEETMYDYIHEHIKSVEIEAIKYNYPFAIGTKQTRAKKITVHFSDGESSEFIYIPFDGKGGKTIIKINNKNLTLQGSDVEKVEFKYLHRFVDMTKVRQKEKHKKKRD